MNVTDLSHEFGQGWFTSLGGELCREDRYGYVLVLGSYRYLVRQTWRPLEEHWEGDQVSSAHACPSQLRHIKLRRS